LLELPIHPALKGAYEILMGLEGRVGTKRSSKQVLYFRAWEVILEIINS